jgi:signal transduction histidine kinase
MNKGKPVPMTINKALLRAFFALVLGAVVLLGALSFYQFRQALRSEIAGNLQFGASAVMQRIDAFFFERIENIRIWRRLEVMQELRVEDVDKRLSQFLADLLRGHGDVYHVMYCTDAKGKVIAASDPAWIGRSKHPKQTWQEIAGTSPDELVVLEPLHTDAAETVSLRTTLPNDFGEDKLGFLYAVMGWEEVWDLLDDAITGSDREALLLDADGRVIAASFGLRQRTDIRGLKLEDWYLQRRAAGADVHPGELLGYDSLLVGSAASGGYQHFPGFGWHLLMLEPTDAAFAPIWHLLWGMSALLLLILMAAGWVSSRLAARIAQPVVSLTEFTRRYRKGEQSRPVSAPETLSEVGELTRAYAEMIEALEQSREQIVRAGKLAVVGEMAAVMAHEVRTPLGILRSSAQLLERQPNQGEKERELTGYIISETDRLNRLVTLLLECASPRAPHFKPLDIHDIIAHVLDLLSAKAEGKEVRLHQELTAEHSILVGDREQLIQVFLNLLLNALHFVPPGGRIDLTTSNKGRTLIARVADNGPGISADNRQRVFDPFFTRREGGIGLGLTIVQQIVQAHQGEIRAMESPLGGACFEIRFDIHDEDNES